MALLQNLHPGVIGSPPPPQKMAKMQFLLHKRPENSVKTSKNGTLSRIYAPDVDLDPRPPIHPLEGQKQPFYQARSETLLYPPLLPL